MKPSVTIVMSCPLCGHDVQLINMTCRPTEGVGIVKCTSCLREASLTVHLRVMASSSWEAERARRRKARVA